MSCSGQLKSKSPWFLAVICRFLACICRFLAVICGSLSVSVGSWRLYVGSWWSSAVPGGYLVLGVLLSCSGQLKMMVREARKAERDLQAVKLRSQQLDPRNPSGFPSSIRTSWHLCNLLEFVYLFLCIKDKRIFCQ